MPHSFSALCSLYANSAEDLDNGKFSARLSSFGGSTVGSMLGRFCHLDEGLRNNVRQLLEDEQTSHPEVIYAEVVHLPQGRIGNVIARPVLREYEIPFLTSGSRRRIRQTCGWLSKKLTQLILPPKWRRLDKNTNCLSGSSTVLATQIGTFGYGLMPCQKCCMAL
jgi:hypothetical protein